MTWHLFMSTLKKFSSKHTDKLSEAYKSFIAIGILPSVQLAILWGRNVKKSRMNRLTKSELRIEPWCILKSSSYQEQQSLSYFFLVFIKQNLINLIEDIFITKAI